MKEIRNLRDEIRNEGESRTVEGYALVFNSESKDLGFREVIIPEALEGVIERSDVFAVVNHDKERGVLARSKYGEGNLSLTIDEKGLKYRFDALNTQLGDELLEYLRAGIIDSSSFAFTVADGGESWEKREDGTYLRTISQIDKLYDVSPVFNPAYAATTAEAVADTRGLDELKNAENELKKIQEAAYWDSIDKRLEKIKS